jgi:ABC-2 type transport system permease protein
MRLRASKVWVLIRREYVSRVKTKAFWISTVLLPVLMVAMFVLPGLMLGRTTGGQRLVVVDETGEVGKLLARELSGGPADPTGRVLRYAVTLEAPGRDPAAERADLDRRILAGDVDAWLWVSDEGLAKGHVEYHAESVSNMITLRRLEDAVSGAVRTVRLERAGLAETQIRDLSRTVELDTSRVTAEGAKAEGGEAGFWLAYGLFFLLYMSQFLYGTQVMNGVLEEKASRVVEVVLATVSPFELMAGKLVGICLVGLTQLSVWLGTAVVLTAPGLVTAAAWLPADMPTIAPMVIVHFFLLFLLGYFIIAALYGAIGASFNNIQEAQQFTSLAAIVLVAPFFFLFQVINDPDSALAVGVSLVPLFTPLLMLVRIVVKTPPAWQIALGYLLTASFCLAMVWLASRIYRVGILMYGKKPTARELWRWVRHA